MENTELCIPVDQPFDPLDGVDVRDDHPAETPLSIEGKVDTQKQGKYTLRYTAVDAVGNTSVIERTVYVYDPEQFQVQLNGQLYFDKALCIKTGQNQFGLIHQEGDVSVKMLKGKASMGDFKLKGNEIADSLLDGSYIFPETGYFTLLVQDQERNTKLVQVFAEE